MTNDTDTKQLIQILKRIVEKGNFPHFHFCGPHNDDVLDFVNLVISDHYSNKSMIMQIHILDNISESHLVQMITAFCNLQAVVADNDIKPKVVIIHQQNESLTDNFVHFLEDRLTEKKVKFVFLTSSMHIIPNVLLNKLVSFTIHPKISPNDKDNNDSEDTFYKILNNNYNDFNILSKNVIDWSELHLLRLPTIIYENWYDIIISNTLQN